MQNPFNQYSIIEVAKLLGISRQAVYNAISKNKFPNCYKLQNPDGKLRWAIPVEDVAFYISHRYERKYWDISKGELSVAETANILSLTTQSVYNLLKSGYLKYKKIGYHYTLYLDDVTKFLEQRDS